MVCMTLLAGLAHPAAGSETYATHPSHRDDPELQAPHVLESDHFRIVWGRGLSKDFTEEQAQGTLRNFEAARTFFIRELGMKPPGERDGRHYRLTIATMKGGYETGGGVINIDPSGLRIDPPSWVIPHELMHAFQEVQGGRMVGDWWESHANYGAERWIASMPQHFAGQSEFDPAFATMAHWSLAHGRDYYLCWPIWCYLDENPDGLPGLGSNFAARMWREAGEEEEFFQLVKRLAPDVDLQDLLGLYTRRAVTWDYRNGAAMRAKMDDFLRDETVGRLVYPELIPRPDDPGWLRVPPEMAPQQGGYVVHRLAPTATAVRVDFRGLPDLKRGADWRVSLVVRNPDGSARYGQMWSTGVGSIALAPDETNLFLVVAATPSNFVFGTQDEMRFPWHSHPQRQRFPYEINLVGASLLPPGSRRGNESAPTHRHPNGGGRVADSARVSPTAFVGKNALVLGTAKVSGTARIEDFAVVRDQAQVRDRAVVSGHARVEHAAVVQDDARLRDWAVVRDQAAVGGQARIGQRATVREKARIRGAATVEGCADVWSEDGAYVGGDAVVSGDYGGGRKVTNGFQYGFVPYEACPQHWIETRTAPHRQFVSYTFDQPHDSLAKDAPGITDGLLLGSPRWRDTDGTRDGLLSFDGNAQAILLETAAIDLQAATFCIWLHWNRGTADAPLLHLAGGTNEFLTVALNGATGRAELLARKNGRNMSVLSAQPIASDRWTHLAAAFDSTNAMLVIDGTLSARGAFPVRPEDFVGPGSVSFFGRDSARHHFSGHIDELRIFSTAIAPERIRDEVMREAGLRGVFFDDLPRRFDGRGQHVPTAIRNLAEGTLAAWVRPESTDDVDTMEGVIHADEPGAFGTGWGLDDGRIKVILNNEFWESGVAIAMGTWQHVALVFSATDARLYVNGQERARHAYARGEVSGRSYEVGRNAAADEFFHGSLFDVRIYDRPLNAAQVRRRASRSPHEK